MPRTSGFYRWNPVHVCNNVTAWGSEQPRAQTPGSLPLAAEHSSYLWTSMPANCCALRMNFSWKCYRFLVGTTTFLTSQTFTYKLQYVSTFWSHRQVIFQTQTQIVCLILKFWQTHSLIQTKYTVGSFGGLVVSMLASGTQVRGFRFFGRKKSTACLPSEGK
jgi:hypothetical protein